VRVVCGHGANRPSVPGRRGLDSPSG
jgi:hypothetical protein